MSHASRSTCEKTGQKRYEKGESKFGKLENKEKKKKIPPSDAEEYVRGAKTKSTQ